MLSKAERLIDSEVKEASSVVNTLRCKNIAVEWAEMPVLRRSFLSPKRRTYIHVRSVANNRLYGVVKSYLPLHSKSASFLKKLLGFAQSPIRRLAYRKGNFANSVVGAITDRPKTIQRAVSNRPYDKSSHALRLTFHVLTISRFHVLKELT